jgi:hypothetical protein
MLESRVPDNAFPLLFEVVERASLERIPEKRDRRREPVDELHAQRRSFATPAFTAPQALNRQARNRQAEPLPGLPD